MHPLCFYDNLLKQVFYFLTSIVLLVIMNGSYALAKVCWIEKENTIYLHLKSLPRMDIEECKHYCERILTNCPVVTHDPKAVPHCMGMESTEPLRDDYFREKSGATTFVLDKDCVESRTFCWIEKENTLYKHLHHMPKNTLDECKDYCERVLRNCLVISFSPRDVNPCSAIEKIWYLHEDRFLEKAGTTTYVLDRGCTGKMPTTGEPGEANQTCNASMLLVVFCLILSSAVAQ